MAGGDTGGGEKYYFLIDKVGWLPIREKIYREAALYLYRISERDKVVENE